MEDESQNIWMKSTVNVIRSKKCNQCHYASSQTGDLRRHLKTHSREKPIICNWCNYASSKAGNLRTHLKMYSEETSNKCNHLNDFKNL